MKTFFDDMAMQASFTREYVETAFRVLDRMQSGTDTWDGWCIDFTGDELAENLLFILDTYC
jgi:hypothetical protein